jgi:hypothetical protein
MGWTCTYKEPGVNLTQWFVDHGVLSWPDDGPYRYRVLDSALVRSVHYAAIERVKKETGERKVFATVILTEPHGRSGNNFCWKDMDESVGPTEDSCPARILDLLTETEGEYARNWRERCRARVAINKSMPKLVVGLKLVFAEPLKFNNGATVSELVIESLKGQRVTCTRPDGHELYRLTRPWLLKMSASHAVNYQAG